ncbi:hypothetical protein JW935_09110 [candidate division KSB1 bacterium]|nr:hypothetical protein [candidate division KSB1 bacterium]
MNIKRPVRIILYLSVMLGLFIYGKVKNPAVTLQMCLNNPQKYDGCEIKVGGEAKVAELTRDGFTIVQMGRKVPVKGCVPNLKPNEFVNMWVIFHKDGWLELQEIYVAVQRRSKIYLSVLPVLLITGLFLYYFKFNLRQIEICER